MAVSSSVWARIYDVVNLLVYYIQKTLSYFNCKMSFFFDTYSVDGYTSDTTAFADDDDDFAVPLHVNTRTALKNDSLSPLAPDR